MKSQSLNTLKDYAKFRLLNDTINFIKSKYGDTLGYYILVVDPDSVKVLSSVCKMYDLISYKISTVEYLNLTRKPFPTSEAIYFISPTRASVEKLLEDFKLPSEPQYSFVHLCFTSTLPEDLMGLISQSVGLVPRIRSLRELNLNFLVKDSDLFHFGVTPNLSIYSPKTITPWTSIFAERLLTVCSAFLEAPYVQYYGGSYFCKEVATSFQAKMKELLSKTNSPPHEPKGTVIILDRTYDLSSPLMHDYCYESIIYDVLAVNKDGAINLDKMSEESKEGKNLMYLGSNDPLWNKYRYMHIGEVFKSLSVDMKEFTSMSKKLNEKAKDLNKLHEALSAMPNHKEIMGSYQFHSRIAQECSNIYTNIDHTNLIKLEQQIITGLNMDGSELDSKNVINAIGRLSLDFPNMTEENKLRLYLLYLINFSVPKREAEFLAKNLTNQSYKDIILSKLETLGQNWRGPEVRNPQRKELKMKREDFELYKERREKSQVTEIMYLPKIAKVALETSQKKLSTAEFPFLGESPIGYGKSQPTKTKGFLVKKARMELIEKDKDNEMWSQPRIILFVIGGISHQEITALFKLQRDGKINNPLTVGSDCIITPKSFIDSIGRIDEVRLEI